MVSNGGLLLRVAALAVVLISATEAVALERKAYTASDFKVAQEAGKPLVVHVHATWCSTCKAQQKVIEDLSANKDFDAVTVYTIDFDKQADDWKSFKATARSTLIAFAGSKETGRLVGETKSPPIEGLFRSALVK